MGILSKAITGTFLYFHICTDGTNNGIVHTNRNDYQNSIKISAICAQVTGIDILCYCHMSTHSHFVIRCTSSEQACSFSQAYKREYSKYCFREHGIMQVYRRVSSTPISISDYFYLKDCIAYVLMNPVEAKIVKRPEDYEWSSISCYFNDNPRMGTPIQAFSGRKVNREIMHSHLDFKGTSLQVDSEYNVLPRSFVKGDIVEGLFMGRFELYRAFGFVKSDEEESKYVQHQVRYNDNELFAEALLLAKSMLGIEDYRQMAKENKYRILKKLQSKTGASNKRLARVLRLNVNEVNAIIGDLAGEDGR